ncbi:Dps family protein [Rhodospirillum rubrum]|uniref:Ferritin and Dps n=1 Tax=Rhodospirillum rubrum (strain ATCC 11170 / ATH 1.1.1 / DSM 467 / LMG 4362 / NCIMB 8255 / S1) TaxID=269796 RepID=Q2RU95_RHORT|nr:ferritin-like domain-containing protein [Rhodospirillum rubrum]ABC22300.1 Ferritin and Dps [Rhodospirillum rubrum ATCC 11170]AEO48018.1 Ferritin and Dps [Rhodospirillum rubrum F11]MBK5953868.1 ferritin [Rhodospirillum rubrum]QXG81941.1 ferritin [Rhodospirillum rubrum]HAP98441.1 ferritin [Rhodospirillum rubrum]
MQFSSNTATPLLPNKSIESLGEHLSWAIELHAQVTQALWASRDPAQIVLHRVLIEVATEIETSAHLMASRITALGGDPRDPLQVEADRLFLLFQGFGPSDIRQQLLAVAASLAAFGHSLREAIRQAVSIDDAPTAHLFIELSRAIDRRFWALDSHISPHERRREDLSFDQDQDEGFDPQKPGESQSR